MQRANGRFGESEPVGDVDGRRGEIQLAVAEAGKKTGSVVEAKEPASSTVRSVRVAVKLERIWRIRSGAVWGSSHSTSISRKGCTHLVSKAKSASTAAVSYRVSDSSFEQLCTARRNSPLGEAPT